MREVEQNLHHSILGFQGGQPTRLIRWASVSRWYYQDTGSTQDYMVPISNGLSVVCQGSNPESVGFGGLSRGDVVGRRLDDLSANHISNTPSQTIKA